MKNSKKKALIYTLYGNVNYGNKLQNYAVQKLLENYNIKACTVIPDKLKSSLIIKLKKIIKMLIPKYRNILKAEKERRILFENFDQKIDKINRNDINLESYDYIYVGSDQVWNSNDELSQQLVRDVNKIDNKKIISIAASIAADNIKEDFLEEYKYHFNKIDNISVREDQGKLLIQEITGRNDIEVLLDPTMLIDISIWEKVMHKPEQFDRLKYSDKEYILTYFLGDINDERKKEIERIAKENNCRIINLMDKNDPFYINGPQEFLYLEKHAFLVCTDSFHSSVFALLFNRPFIIFEREQEGISNMNSRLETLITKFELKNRKYNKKITKENLQCNYSEALKILKKEKEKCDEFIKKAI